MLIERSSNPMLFFSKREKGFIVSAIQEAEKRTSAEIRVHLERKAKPDIMAHAKAEFERLGMARTNDRNGVLVFMGIHSKRFAVLGDKGIYEKTDQAFWNDIIGIMSAHFKEDRFAEGIVEVIHRTGDKLREFFPYQRDDINELPDEISYSL